MIIHSLINQIYFKSMFHFYKLIGHYVDFRVLIIVHRETKNRFRKRFIFNNCWNTLSTNCLRHFMLINTDCQNFTVDGQRISYFVPQLRDIQQDGARSHTALNTCNGLSKRIFSRKDPLNWALHWCALTLLDYFLWGSNTCKQKLEALLPTYSVIKNVVSFIQLQYAVTWIQCHHLTFGCGS